MITYCTKCLFPNSKPDLLFDDRGVCIACNSYDDRSSIDWGQRRLELDEILNRYRKKDGSNWDCIVPVSGSAGGQTRRGGMRVASLVLMRHIHSKCSKTRRTSHLRAGGGGAGAVREEVD